MQERSNVISSKRHWLRLVSLQGIRETLGELIPQRQMLQKRLQLTPQEVRVSSRGRGKKRGKGRGKGTCTPCRTFTET
eukprot:9492688-Pyramimonas_sp.AAC.1